MVWVIDGSRASDAERIEAKDTLTNDGHRKWKDAVQGVNDGWIKYRLVSFGVYSAACVQQP